MASESMIERGARAIIVCTIPAYADDAQWAEHWAWYLTGRGEGGCCDYSTLAVAERQFRAAIRSMHEPSEHQDNRMRVLLGPKTPATRRWHWVWQEMIDAILSESPTPGDGT